MEKQEKNKADFQKVVKQIEELIGTSSSVSDNDSTDAITNLEVLINGINMSELKAKYDTNYPANKSVFNDQFLPILIEINRIAGEIKKDPKTEENLAKSDKLYKSKARFNVGILELYDFYNAKFETLKNTVKLDDNNVASFRLLLTEAIKLRDILAIIEQLQNEEAFTNSTETSISQIYPSNDFQNLLKILEEKEKLLKDFEKQNGSINADAGLDVDEYLNLIDQSAETISSSLDILSARFTDVQCEDTSRMEEKQKQFASLFNDKKDDINRLTIFRDLYSNTNQNKGEITIGGKILSLTDVQQKTADGLFPIIDLILNKYDTIVNDCVKINKNRNISVENAATELMKQQGEASKKLSLPVSNENNTPLNSAARALMSQQGPDSNSNKANQELTLTKTPPNTAVLAEAINKPTSQLSNAAQPLMNQQAPNLGLGINQLQGSEYTEVSPQQPVQSTEVSPQQPVQSIEVSQQRRVPPSIFNDLNMTNEDFLRMTGQLHTQIRP
jgi:hypothetical protein